ncbi:hypothetical protein BGZ67_000448 [Mortierella alpina]|nr:hypothetical protein BGZ67_000448 [Mortierella alpina]
MFSSPMLLDFNSNSKRSKITKACDNCRRRRVKCDGVPDGCGGCKAAKTQCVYTSSNTKRGPPKGYVEVIEDRLGKIENMLAGIVKKKTVLVPQSSSYRSTPSHSDNEDNNEDDDQASVDSSDLVHVKKQPSSPALRPTRSSTPNISSNARSGSVAFSTLGRHSPLVSRNRSLTTLLPFSQPSQLHEQQQQDAHADMAALTSMFDNMGTTSVRTTVPFPWLTPEQSQQYGRNYLQFSSQSLEPPLPTLARSFPPTTSPDTTLQLFNNFFRHFNAHLPIVDRFTFMRQWQQASCQLCQLAPSNAGTSPPKANPKQHQHDVQAHKEHLQHPIAPLSPLLLNALLAIASKTPTDDKQTTETAHKASALSQGFFDAARLLLDDFMDVPRVSTVQALCLMSQFHHQGEWRATRSSSYLAMAIRMAHELGLNRDPEIAYAPEADALRYLWWSMFILDHLFSAWLGLGLLMHGKESDVELPTTFGSSSIELRGFICMVKILGTVLQHSYSTQSLPPQFGGHDSMVSYIEGSLTSWLSNLAPDMRWQNPNFTGARRLSPGSPMRSPRQHATFSDAHGVAGLGKEEIYPSYLYIVYNTTLILLHRPYIVGAAGSPAAAQSNTICTGSGRAITDIAQGLDMERCSYVVNRFAVYALLQAGVIHAMNAVYDKRGSEAAMEYFTRTIRVLEGFSVFTAYSGGVTEGIKILEQFLATTSNAAAEEEGNSHVQETSEYCQQERIGNQQEPMDSQANRGKKRPLETSTAMISPCTPMGSSGEYQQSSCAQSTSAPGTLAQVASTISTHSVQSTIEPTARPLPPSYVFDNDQQQLQQQLQQQQRLQQQVVDMKEQQKQQQLKIQQQHRMYQQMQTFGAGAVKVESKAESDLQTLEQQQLQQQQLLRQQLQRQQQRQQQEMELKEQNASAAAAASVAAAASAAAVTAAMNPQFAPLPTMAAPVIPSHRHAMQLLQQQQHQQHSQHPQHQLYLQQGQHGHVSMPMTMTMAAMTMEAQGKMNHQELPMSGMMNSGASTGYDPTQFWVDFSATDATMSCAHGSTGIHRAATETVPSQVGASPLWM